jgi:hypothetical protein
LSIAALLSNLITGVLGIGPDAKTVALPARINISYHTRITTSNKIVAFKLRRCISRAVGTAATGIFFISAGVTGLVTLAGNRAPLTPKTVGVTGIAAGPAVSNTLTIVGRLYPGLLFDLGILASGQAGHDHH